MHFSLENLVKTLSKITFSICFKNWLKTVRISENMTLSILIMNVWIALKGLMKNSILNKKT